MNYCKASYEDLEKIWNRDIEENKDDMRYIKWKDEFIAANKNGDIVTFVAKDEDQPIGQITLVLNKDCLKVSCRDKLCDGENCANFSTFRIDKKYENQGHISTLVRLAEDYARGIGIKFITIGAEAKESRTLAIYLHLGFREFVTSIYDSGDLILYYKKYL